MTTDQRPSTDVENGLGPATGCFWGVLFGVALGFIGYLGLLAIIAVFKIWLP